MSAEYVVLPSCDDLDKTVLIVESGGGNDIFITIAERPEDGFEARQLKHINSFGVDATDLYNAMVSVTKEESY